MKIRHLLACLVLHGLASGPAPASPGQEGGPPGAPTILPGASAPTTGLIADLGSESWSRREDAQEKLLREGLRVAPLLEAALRSDNIEVAYRARYLLAQIDPQVTEFQILKIDTRTRSVLELASVSGASGQTMTARSAGDGATASYSIEFRAVDAIPERIEIWVTQVSPGAGGMEIRREARSPADVIILKRSDEGLYRRLGLQMERERHPSVTAARVRTGRRSVLERASPGGSRKASAIQELVEDLRKQAVAPDPASRATAIDLLGELGEAGTLDEALADPETRAVAAVAVGSPDLLAEVMLAPRGRPASFDGARDMLAVRAAEKLLASGDDTAVEFLVARLAEGDAAQLHGVMAALADRVARAPLEPEVRTVLLEVAFSEDVLGRALWEDVETEYFFATLAGTLDGGNPGDVQIAHTLLERVERLARGELGPMPVRFRAALDLRRRIARRIPGAADLPDAAMVLRVLPALGDAASVSEALTFLEESVMLGGAQPVDAAAADPSDSPASPDISLVLGTIAASIESGDSGIAAAAFQSLLRLARTLPESRGQLRPLVLALIRACESTARDPGTEDSPRPPSFASNLVRQAEERLAALTGVRPGPVDRGAGGPVTKRRFDGTEWKTWVEDAALVEAREEEILSGGPADTGSTPADLVYYEFDLLVDGDAHGEGEGPAFEVLDARRLEVRTGTAVAYEDRWGNRMRLKIDQDGAQQGPDRPARFRLNARPTLFVGLPVLAGVQGRILGASWHETSDTFFGSVPIQRPGLPAYRTLSYLAHPDGAPPPPAGVRDAEDPTMLAQGLWSWFLEKHLLNVPDDAPPHTVNAVVGIIRTLRIKECAPFLRRLFERAPTPDLARHLHEVGDTSGIEYLRRELEAGREDARVRAALILCELGFDDGARALIDGAATRRQLVRRMNYQVTNALDAYLKNPGTLGEVREEVLDFLFAMLDDPVFQMRAFVLIERQLGMDFGFTSARGMDDQEKRRDAIAEAVKSAREWRASRKGKRF
jgi:hypothetical protein